MDEKSVCANIQKLTEQLNGELKAAGELGLKVQAQVFDKLGRSSFKELSIRVWRETDLVNIGDNYRTWPIEKQIQLRELIVDRLNEQGK